MKVWSWKCPLGCKYKNHKKLLSMNSAKRYGSTHLKKIHNRTDIDPILIKNKKGEIK